MVARRVTGVTADRGTPGGPPAAGVPVRAPARAAPQTDAPLRVGDGNTAGQTGRRQSAASAGPIWSR